MKCWFGKIEDGKVIYNKLGKVIKECFENIPRHFEFVGIDYHVIMPNHIHGIIIINPSVQTGHAPSVRTPTQGNIIGSFKSAVTRWHIKMVFPISPGNRVFMTTLSEMKMTSTEHEHTYKTIP